jgi:HNH endonuclease
MSFEPSVREDALVACGRHCCLCHKFCGLKIELHHIKQKSEGGLDDYENCIPLCFDCHADMRSYDHRHPKGTKYTPSELTRHRDNWYKKVSGSPGSTYSEKSAEVDKAVFALVKSLLNYETTVKFLDRHDFGSPFPHAHLDALDTFIEKMDDPECEFIDTDLEGIRVSLIECVNSFRLFASLNTWPAFMNDKYQSVPPEWQDTQCERFDRVTDELHDLSKRIVVAHSELTRECRKRLGVV